jgi:hypothetical protein
MVSPFIELTREAAPVQGRTAQIHPAGKECFAGTHDPEPAFRESTNGNVRTRLLLVCAARWMSIGSVTSEVVKARGTVAGFNAGVFARGAVVMLGGLISFEVADTSSACLQQDGHPTGCSADVSTSSTEAVFSVSGSVLF